MPGRFVATIGSQGMNREMRMKLATRMTTDVATLQRYADEH